MWPINEEINGENTCNFQAQFQPKKFCFCVHNCVHNCPTHFNSPKAQINCRYTVEMKMETSNMIYDMTLEMTHDMTTTMIQQMTLDNSFEINPK